MNIYILIMIVVWYKESGKVSELSVIPGKSLSGIASEADSRLGKHHISVRILSVRSDTDKPDIAC